MSITRLFIPYALVLATAAILGCHASAHSNDKKALPFGKRNFGGQLKDWYLSKFTHNYFCTDTGRLVPVDPETGHMLLKGLRRRNFVDDLFHHSHQTEHGICKHPTWVLPQGWTQPIPVTQFEAQYPWMKVDERGEMHFQEDYEKWLEDRAASKSDLAGGAVAGGAAGGAAPDGGVGYVPPSALNTGAGLGGSSGLGTNAFGNGVAAGTAAHV